MTAPPLTATPCALPLRSALDPQLLAAAWFHDSYRTALRRRDASAAEIFQAVFGHSPLWVKWVLVVRNRIASWCGLDAPTVAEIMQPRFKSAYAVGDKIGPWPIFALSDTELVAGRNNKHLDFRVSVLRESEGAHARAVVTTICVVHNVVGKVYLFFVIPFHRWGVRHLILRAVAAGRL